jgi:hypothetical protein
MNRVAFHSVLRDAAGLAGFTMGQLTATPKTQLKTFIARRAKQYWNHAWWNQIMHAELRYYRDAYDAATAYAEDDEVYYSTTGKYYSALQATTGNLPTDETYWEEITELDAYIALAQTGQNVIGTVRQLSPDNPLEVRDPRVQPFRPMGDRIQVTGEDVPSSIYVWYREPAPTWLGDDFDEAETYGVGDVMYYEGAAADYEGDFWECVTATTAGQDPEDTPAKWERIAFPEWLALPVGQAAYADWLRQDGNPEVAALEAAEAQNLLFKEIHRDGPAQRQVLRSSGA